MMLRLVNGLTVCGLVVAAIAACALLGRVSVTASQATPSRDLAELQRSLEGGSYAEVERRAAQLCARFESEYGLTSLELARAQDLLVSALVKNGKAGAPTTLALAEHVLRVKEQILARDDPEIALSLHGLGAVRTERGEFAASVPLHERALAMRERVFDPDDAGIADSLDYLALPLVRLQRFDDARRRLERSRRIREALATHQPLPLASTLELTALLERYSGNYGASMPYLDRAIETRRRLAPDHPDLILPLNIKADVLWLTGDVDGAQRVWNEALSLGERTLGSDHPTVGLLLRKAATAADYFGDVGQSRALLDRALVIDQQSLAECHPEVPLVLNDLATLEQNDDARYARARQLFHRALGILERCLGPNHSLTATIVYNLAELATEMGDLSEAERLHERAIRSWSASLGPRHSYVANAVDGLAEVAALRGQRVRARALYERALDIRRRAVGADHPDVASTLIKLAETVAQSSDLPDAQKRLTDAIGILERAGASLAPDRFARALSLRGELEARRRDFVAAQASFAEALATRERIFGKTHPLTAKSRSDVAMTDFALSFFDRAVPAALDAERDWREQFRFTVRYLPERQALMYAGQRPQALALALSVVASRSATSQSDVFDAVIRSRGVLLDELAARARSTIGDDPGLATLSASVSAARERFATLMLRSLREALSVQPPVLDEARRQKEDAERSLAERSASIRAELDRARAGLTEVRRALPADTALVSFVRYERSVVSRDQQRATTVLRTIPSYMAFVIRPDSTAVTAILLGAANLIETAVQAWRDQAAGRSVAAGVDTTEAEAAYRRVGEKLRRRIWDPVAPSLSDASHVLIVPDGALNMVSFAALPTAAHRYLGEQPRTIHYLSTERDVIPIDRPATADGLLAVGGASFDTRAPHTKPSPVGTSVQRSGCGNLRSIRFEELPGSRDEVADIARIWSHWVPAEVTVLTGRSATETAVKKAIVGRQVVHLATHGFFMGSDCDSAPVGTRGVGALSSPRTHMSAMSLENPLLLSGLALSGANNHISGTAANDDGILTAEEVASLNLQATDWAVLSACDTGIGEVKAGEGVFGLRRAFQVAGARTVIMSLWSVDDQATRQWMRTLYQDRLEKRLSTADAVRDASLSVLRARRARGESTHPFYWAGFVAAGDWR
jgi:CHAT domain-containing protein